MKSNTHPTWHNDCKVTCNCGHSFTTGSTFKTLQVDICSNCHPFYTGEMRFVDVQGRVEKFQAKQKKAQAMQSTGKGKKKKTDTSNQPDPKTLQEMLKDAKKEVVSTKA